MAGKEQGIHGIKENVHRPLGVHVEGTQRRSIWPNEIVFFLSNHSVLIGYKLINFFLPIDIKQLTI